MIRKAIAADISIVEEIYHEVLDFEANHMSYTNWKKDLYPTRKTAEQALEEGTLYVGEDETGIYGCVILNHIQPEEYGKISWSVPAEGQEVLVIHTLCIRPNCAGKGYGREFVAFSEQLGKKLGCTTMRLDTYEGNLPAASLYLKLGYQEKGSVEFHFQNVIWETLKCFDKILQEV